jgi:hypothetical protein
MDRLACTCIAIVAGFFFFFSLRSGESIPSIHCGTIYDSHGLWIMGLGSLALWMIAGLDGGYWRLSFIVEDLTLCQPPAGCFFSVDTFIGG